MVSILIILSTHKNIPINSGEFCFYGIKQKYVG